MSTPYRTPEPAATSSRTVKAPIPQDPAAIQAAIEERQRHLGTTVDELRHRLQPKELARRAAESAQRKAQDAITAEDGSLRTERIGAVAAALASLVGLVVLRRVRRMRRERRSRSTVAAPRAPLSRTERARR